MPGTRVVLAMALVWLSTSVMVSGQAESAAELLVAGERASTQTPGVQRSKASLEQARGLFERALARAQESQDRPSEARAHYRLGQTAIYLDDARAAIAHFDQAIPLFHSLALPVDEARALNNKAVALWQLGEASEALDAYQLVLPLRRQLKDRRGEALTLAGMANCYLAMGETATALNHYRQVHGIWQELADPDGLAENHNSTGNALVQLGELDRAQIEFEQAQALWRQKGNRLRLLYVRNNLGWVAIGRKAFRTAQTHLAGLVTELEPTGDRRAVSYVHHNLGSVYSGLGDPARARESFLQSLAIKREIGDRVGAAYTLQALGEIAATREETLRYWAEALTIRRDVPDAQGLIVTLGALARLHRDEKQLAQSRGEIEEAIELIESRRAALVSQDLRATYFAGKRDYYEFLAAILLDQGETAAALAVADRARGRQLLDRLSDTLAGLRQGVPPVLLGRERKIQQAINAAAEQGTRPKLPALLREAHDIAEEIRRQSPHYASLVSPQPVTASQIQKLLGPGEVLVQYLLSETSSFVWTVTPTAIQVDRLPGRRAIEQLVRPWRTAVVERANWATTASSLRRTLVPRSLDGYRRVILAADGVLESIPFGLILGDRLELASLPSATALALRRTEATRPARRVDVLADPVFSPSDARLTHAAATPPANVRARLRFSRTEAESIGALVPAASLRVAMDFSANRSFLHSASDAAVLHLATHTEVDSTQPELSGLALSQYDAQGRPVEGFVRLGEVFGLSLRARLVTLSSCRSARGTDLPGEGLVSLTRGFLYAGAGTVLASLWDVDDRATAELMRRFYRAHLQQKLPPPAALRAAQMSLRAEPGWEHPYYWAAFTLQGEWR